jgi:hypothetical protein
MITLVRSCIALALICVPAMAAPAKPVPSGPLKAYKGPEGELVVLVPVNDSKEMLVHFRHLGGPLEGTSALYLYEDKGNDHREVYSNKKRGSKTYRAYVLTDYDSGSWTFINPSKTSQSFTVYFSETESKKIKVDEVVDAYKP